MELEVVGLNPAGEGVTFLVAQRESASIKVPGRLFSTVLLGG